MHPVCFLYKAIYVFKILKSVLSIIIFNISNNKKKIELQLITPEWFMENHLAEIYKKYKSNSKL